jgi:dienelactone hydrolase
MMCLMSATESFKLEVGSSEVTGTLMLPRGASARSPSGSVIICQGIAAAGDNAAAFLDELAAAVVDSGLAAVRFEHRCADLILEDFDAHTAAHDLDDALAVYRWLVEREDIDEARIGVLGYSYGAIAATAIARRLEAINRLCLIAPATARHVRATSNGANEQVTDDHAHRMPAAYAPSLAETDSGADAAFHNRPTLIVHGAADRFIGPEVAFEYRRALEFADRPVEHILIARAVHDFAQPGVRQACLRRVGAFFAAMEVVASSAVKTRGKTAAAGGVAPKR